MQALKYSIIFGSGLDPMSSDTEPVKMARPVYF